MIREETADTAGTQDAHETSEALADVGELDIVRESQEIHEVEEDHE